MVSDSRGVSNIHTTSSAPRLMLKDSLANGHEDASRGVDPNGRFVGRFLQPMQRRQRSLALGFCRLCGCRRGAWGNLGPGLVDVRFVCGIPIESIRIFKRSS